MAFAAGTKPSGGATLRYVDLRSDILPREHNQDRRSVQLKKRAIDGSVNRTLKSWLAGRHDEKEEHQQRAGTSGQQLVCRGAEEEKERPVRIARINRLACTVP